MYVDTLEAVKIGILTDEQLEEALKHYSLLEPLLRIHGEKYHLVWKDVYLKLLDLKSMDKSRREKKDKN